MKFSTPTLMAILATSAVVSAAPSPIEISHSTQLVKKSDVANALSIIEELGQLNAKRSLSEDGNEIIEISKRADSLLAELISALSNSGIIGDVWNILTTDSTLKTEVVSLVKEALTGAVAAAPSLIKAVWNSGLLQAIFEDIYNSSDLRLVLFSAAKTLFSSGLNLLKAFLAAKTGSSTTTTAASTTTTAAAKREIAIAQFDSDEFYDKRDLVSVAETVYTAIKNTGIVQSLVKKVLADPQASISFLETVIKKGWVVGKDIYNWANSSGLLKEGLTWIANNGGKYATAIAEFLGSKIVSGSATTSDVDNASTISTTATTTTSTSTATTLVKRRLY